MNAAISSSVVLASRLANDLAVFALIMFAVQGFTMFPILRQRLQASQHFQTLLNLQCLIPLPKVSPPPVTALLTVILLASCLRLTMPLSVTVTCLYAITFIFVTFLAPAVLVWAQKYKKYLPFIFLQYQTLTNAQQRNPRALGCSGSKSELITTIQ